MQAILGTCSKDISVLYYVLYIEINWHYIATWSVQKLRIRAVASERLSANKSMDVYQKQEKISYVVNVK